MKERFIQLDALRGLAAFTVLLNHLKRFCRIYIPYALTIFLGLVLLQFAPKFSSTSFSSIINNTWTHNLNMSEVLDHFAALGLFNTRSLNSVIWTLIHEMRISIIFPFVVLLLANRRLIYSFLAVVIFSVLGALNAEYHFQYLATSDISYFDTLHYLAFFILGMIIAKHRAVLIPWFQRFAGSVKLVMLLVGIVFYNYAGYMMRFGFNEVFGVHAFNRIVSDYVIVFGIVIFLIFSLASPRGISVLASKIPIFLGKISYSLYLTHMVVILAILHYFDGQAPMALLLFAAGCVSIPIGYLGYRFVELPSMALGRKWSASLTAKRKKRQNIEPSPLGRGRTAT